MKKLTLTILFIVLILPFFSYSQLKTSPYVSVGYINHIGRNGINTELGLDFEFKKRINISPNYRYASLANDTENEITINSLSLFLSYILLNKKQYKLMVGSGISYGSYKRFTSNIGLEKNYNDIGFNPIKLRYNYLFSSKIKIGLDASIYGDDGDGSTFIGINFGYGF